LPGADEFGPRHVVERAATALRQAAVARVLQLLDAERQRDVGRARGHRIDRAAKRLGARRAIILDARHRDVRQAQGHRQRHGGLADMLLLDGGGEPGRVDLLRLDAGVGDRLDIGLDHQVFGVHVPALAEFRAAHAENGDLVANALRHAQPSFAKPAIGAAFQK
jgi:hypothetical protein